MAEVKLRFNLDAEEVELVVDGQVAMSSGSDVFANWVQAYNTKHPQAVVHQEPVKVEAPVPAAPVNVDAPVPEPAVETPAVEVNTDPAPVDNPESE